MKSCRHKSRDMCDIHHQYGADFVSDFSEFLEIKRSRVSRSAGNNHFRPALQRDFTHFVIVEESFIVNAVRHAFEVFTGHIYRRTVRKVSAVVQIHSHKSVSRLHYRKKYCHISLRAGMRLNIHIFTSEKLFRPVSCQIFNNVNALAAAVISFSRISFCIFIRQRASHSSHDRFADPVFRRNQLNMRVLTLLLGFDCLRNFRVRFFNLIK